MIAWTNALVIDDVQLVILSGFLNFISMCPDVGAFEGKK
jgi:hypothetical protein